jgi:hypothetical protein
VVVVIAAAGRALPQVERCFVMMGVGRVDGKMDIAGVRAAVDRIQGVDHQARMVVRFRERRPTHASAYRSLVPCLGDFVLVARQSRRLRDAIRPIVVKEKLWNTYLY